MANNFQANPRNVLDLRYLDLPVEDNDAFYIEQPQCEEYQDSCVREWRPVGKWSNQAFYVERYMAPAAGIMVIGAITY
ncbi:hypothetical protein NPIL_596531 [Nephila pilipes]|uniref:Uncharacterized protein n=1 Tax=Nephila pilipes TaxID=299642 RepID=A0A8X6R1R4_NEPPI|nr:hypothetical protein NPIL_596531 [Nephila pilipes]